MFPLNSLCVSLARVRYCCLQPMTLTDLLLIYFLSVWFPFLFLPLSVFLSTCPLHFITILTFFFLWFGDFQEWMKNEKSYDKNRKKMFWRCLIRVTLFFFLIKNGEYHDHILCIIPSLIWVHMVLLLIAKKKKKKKQQFNPPLKTMQCLQLFYNFGPLKHIYSLSKIIRWFDLFTIYFQGSCCQIYVLLKQLTNLFLEVSI